MEIRRLHIFISGKVQGVFFRDFVKLTAESFNFKGWCKNLADGRVEIIVEGKEEKMKDFLRRLREGPPHAEIENIDYEQERTTNEFKEFRVLYL